MLGKASVTLDHVNDELEKVGTITDSAVGRGRHRRPRRARRVGGRRQARQGRLRDLGEGVEHAFESLKSKRRQRGGVV